MNTCLFATDLHGRSDRYEKLFRAIESLSPRAVFLGGDLMPHVLMAREFKRAGYDVCVCGSGEFAKIAHDFDVPFEPYPHNYSQLYLDRHRTGYIYNIREAIRHQEMLYQGEYDLQITNVSIEDDDEFQCQVGPGAAGEPPLLGIAVLTVLSKQIPYRFYAQSHLWISFLFCYFL